MKNHHWYRVLRKPSWAPPAWLFAPVWALLYILMALSFGYVGFLFLNKFISWSIVIFFLLNFIFNMAFTPILFGFHRLGLAALDVFLVLATLAWALVLIYPFAPWVVFVNIPYLLWLAFATVLQFRIAVLNHDEQKVEIPIAV